MFSWLQQAVRVDCYHHHPPFRKPYTLGISLPEDLKLVKALQERQITVTCSLASHVVRATNVSLMPVTGVGCNSIRLPKRKPLSLIYCSLCLQALVRGCSEQLEMTLNWRVISQTLSCGIAQFTIPRIATDRRVNCWSVKPKRTVIPRKDDKMRTSVFSLLVICGLTFLLLWVGVARVCDVSQSTLLYTLKIVNSLPISDSYYI